MEIEDLFKDRSNEDITAFAFNVGRMVDMSIKARNLDREDRIKELEAKICNYRNKLVPNVDGQDKIRERLLKEFDDAFGIVKCTTGKV